MTVTRFPTGDSRQTGGRPEGRTRSVEDGAFGTAVPRVFMVTLDLLTLAFAFLVTYPLAPYLKRLTMSAAWFAPWATVLAADPAGAFRSPQDMAWVLLVMSALVILSLQALSAYRPLAMQSRAQVALSTIGSPVAGLCGIALVLFALRNPSWSRFFIFLFTGLSIVALSTIRFTLRWYHLRRIASGFYARYVVLAGSARIVDAVAEYLQRTTTPAHYQVMGYLEVSPHAGPPPPTLRVPKLGHVDGLGDLLVHQPIHEVIAIQGAESGEWLREMIEICDYFRVTLRLVPEALLFGGLKDLQFVYRADPLRLPEIVLRPRDFASDALFVKRLLDIVVSGALLVVLSPVFLAIAIAIKISTPRLPIFYRWQVVGFRGRRFTGYKFSTMVADAESRRADLIELNEMQGPVFKIKNDPRVTGIGRFLRKFSLNELPQLWSVLKGDMSLVGPRPAFPHELQRYELWHKRKLCVRPGITCLWQVRGRNRISQFDDWVRMDLEYIDNWSLWLDVKILFRTAWAVVKGTGS
ncbi:MAG TPA: sugar transferase [Vicinamibacterales bacterium]|nr:sugar transferase [Vicinamibacterales bacterium]